MLAQHWPQSQVNQNGDQVLGDRTAETDFTTAGTIHSSGVCVFVRIVHLIQVKV
jgi:hypothetical protein